MVCKHLQCHFRSLLLGGDQARFLMPFKFSRRLTLSFYSTFCDKSLEAITHCLVKRVDALSYSEEESFVLGRL